MNAIELMKKRKQESKDYEIFVDDVVAKAKKYNISIAGLFRDYVCSDGKHNKYMIMYRAIIEKSRKLSKDEIGYLKFFLKDDIDKRIKEGWEILERFLRIIEDKSVRNEAIKILSIMTSFKRHSMGTKLNKLAITKSPVYLDKNLVNAMAYVIEQQN